MKKIFIVLCFLVFFLHASSSEESELESLIDQYIFHHNDTSFTPSLFDYSLEMEENILKFENRECVEKYVSYSILPGIRRIICEIIGSFFPIVDSESIENLENLEFMNSTDFVTSPNDHRQYRYLRLGNEMKVMLISDLNATISAAAVDIHAGSFQDFDEWPGIAHFLEHMLFVGSEKFPNSDQFFRFIEQHGGGSNAYTDDEDTNYYFSIAHGYLDEALKMFREFFLSPSLAEEMITKEIHAVDNEYHRSIPDFATRYHGINQFIVSDKTHPWGKFNMGNVDTLLKDGIQDALQRFHQKYTSANIMSIAIISYQNLDDLQKLVEKYFNDIPNRNATLKDIPDASNLYTNKLEGSKLPIYVASRALLSLDKLSFTWNLPAYTKQYNQQPFLLFDQLVCSQHKNGLKYLLKNDHKWILSLTCYVMANSGFASAVMDFTLSEEGCKHVDDIAQIVFQYFDLINQNKNKFIHYWQELLNLDKIAFTYMKKRGYSS